MSGIEINEIREAMEQRVGELEKERERAEQQYRGDGSNQAAWRKVEPKIKRDVVEDCLQDIEETNDWDNLLLVLATWRRQKNDEWAFNRNNSGVENQRHDIQGNEIKRWIEELTDIIPDREFETCFHCESVKMPTTDGKYKKGYRWDCLDCP